MTGNISQTSLDHLVFLCLLIKPDYCANMLIYLILLLSAEGRVLLHMLDIL